MNKGPSSRIPAVWDAIVPTPPTAKAEAPTVPQPGPFELPLVYTIRSVRPGAQIEIDGVITDARGRSVQYLPLAMDGRTTVPEIETILQQSVAQIAHVLYTRGEAALPTAAPQKADLQSLVTRTFRGSIAR